MTILTAPKFRSIKPGFLFVIVFLLVVITYFVVLFFSVKGRIESRFAVVEKQMNSLQLPADKVEYRSVATGRGFEALGCIAERCPNMQRIWFTPIALDEELELTRTIMEQAGYEVEASDLDDCTLRRQSLCGVIGKKDNLRMSVNIAQHGTADPPDRDVSPKHWRFLIIRIEMTD